MALLVFLIGAIPFAQIIAEMHGDGDLRRYGNVGAGNLARVAGRQWGALAASLDVLKALLPIAFMSSFGWLREMDILWLGAMAMAGHNYSPFLGWRAGKGASVACALLFYLNGWVFIASLVVGGIVYRRTGYVPGAIAGILLGYESVAWLDNLSPAVKLAPVVFGLVALLAVLPYVLRAPGKTLPPTPNLRG